MGISNPAAAKKVATGTYTGDGAAARQKTTGFKCGAVIISRSGAATTSQGMFVVLMPGDSQVIITGGTCITSTDALHASDGFVLGSATNSAMNVFSKTYSYWAIEA